MLATSAFLPSTVANLHFQLSYTLLIVDFCLFSLHTKAKVKMQVKPQYKYPSGTAMMKLCTLPSSYSLLSVVCPVY